MNLSRRVQLVVCLIFTGLTMIFMGFVWWSLQKTERHLINQWKGHYYETQTGLIESTARTLSEISELGVSVFNSDYIVIFFDRELDTLDGTSQEEIEAQLPIELEWETLRRRLVLNQERPIVIENVSEVHAGLLVEAPYCYVLHPTQGGYLLYGGWLTIAQDRFQFLERYTDKRFLEVIKIMLIVWVAILLLLIVCIPAYLRRHIFRPLAQIREGCARMTDSDRKDEIICDSPREFSEVADAINKMLAHRDRAERDVCKFAIHAEEAEKMRTAFLMYASHHLRTPLNALVGLPELIEEDLEEGRSEEAMVSVRMIRRQGSKILHVVETMFELSQKGLVDPSGANKCKDVIELTRFIINESDAVTVMSGQPSAVVSGDCVSIKKLGLPVSALYSALRSLSTLLRSKTTTSHLTVSVLEIKPRQELSIILGDFDFDRDDEASILNPFRNPENVCSEQLDAGLLAIYVARERLMNYKAHVTLEGDDSKNLSRVVITLPLLD